MNNINKFICSKYYYYINIFLITKLIKNIISLMIISFLFINKYLYIIIISFIIIIFIINIIIFYIVIKF